MVHWGGPFDEWELVVEVRERVCERDEWSSREPSIPTKTGSELHSTFAVPCRALGLRP